MFAVHIQPFGSSFKLFLIYPFIALTCLSSDPHHLKAFMNFSYFPMGFDGQNLTVQKHNGTFRKELILPEQGTEPSRLVVKFWLGECKKLVRFFFTHLILKKSIGTT